MCEYRRPESSETLAQRYEDQARKQRALVRDLQRLRGMSETLQNGFRLLMTDDHFGTLLRTEGLDRVPSVLVNHSVRKEMEKTDDGDGVSEVNRLLHSKKLSPAAQYELDRMVPARQEEAARLMIATGCFISPYVRALVCASDASLIAREKGRPRSLAMKPPQRDAASREISELASQLKELSESGSADQIALLVSCRYLQRVLCNRRVRGYLRKRWAEIGKDWAFRANSQIEGSGSF
ncbi:MAG: plasmid partitioning protein RepB C-terminal domain-containing protein [Bryobacteraceae bacterium]